MTSAGNYLIAAGFVAAATGGLYGLAVGRPEMVVLSVLLAIGYSVAGYLLVSKRDAAFTPALALSGVLVVATLGVLRPEVARFLQREFAYFIVFPALGILLALAGAHLLAYGLARRNGRVLWPARGTEAVSPLLVLAAMLPVLNAFVLLYVSREDGTASTLVVASAIASAVATALGGITSSIRRHPRFTLLGAGVGFLANVAFLFQFAPLVPRDVGYWGQLNALAGMLLCGFPLAMSVVAWVELESAKRGAAPASAPPAASPSGVAPPMLAAPPAAPAAPAVAGTPGERRES